MAYDKSNPDPWSNEFYTNEQLGTLSEVIKGFDRTGKPEMSRNVRLQMADLIPFKHIEIPAPDVPVGSRPSIRPETGIDVSLIEEPPRSGKGSGQKAWAEFAGLVSDMDEEVIEQFSRDELISILVDRDVIDPEDE